MIETQQPWIQLVNGEPFDLFDPNPDLITIGIIANALSKATRYVGQTKYFYSVAEHCVLLAEWMENRNPDETNAIGWALLHDAAEAYTGDISAPMKAALGEEGRARLKQIEDDILAIVAEKFNLSPEIPEIVKQGDNRILLNERRTLQCKSKKRWLQDEQGTVPIVDKDFNTIQLHLWPHDVAHDKFIECAENIFLSIPQ